MQLPQHLQHIVTEELNKNTSHYLGSSMYLQLQPLIGKERQNMYFLEREHLKLKQDNCGKEIWQKPFAYK